MGAHESFFIRFVMFFIRFIIFFFPLTHCKKEGRVCRPKVMGSVKVMNKEVMVANSL